jgi:hypothetical protein
MCKQSKSERQNVTRNRSLSKLALFGKIEDFFADFQHLYLQVRIAATKRPK